MSKIIRLLKLFGINLKIKVFDLYGIFINVIVQCLSSSLITNGKSTNYTNKGFTFNIKVTVAFYYSNITNMLVHKHAQFVQDIVKSRR